MTQFKQSLKVGFAAMVLAFAYMACGGDKTPQHPEPPPPEMGCCQLDAQCVEVDDEVACEQRGGEFLDGATCSLDQCVIE